MWANENEVSFPDVHAGMIETSIVQAYWPNLVAHFEDIDFLPDVEPALPQSVFQALGIYAVSKTGVWGKPQQSNPAKGKLIIDTVVKEIYGQVIKLRELIEHQSA